MTPATTMGPTVRTPAAGPLDRSTDPVRPVPAVGRDRVCRRWSTIHRRQLAATDALVIIWAVAGAHVLRFGGVDASVDVRGLTSNYLVVSALLAVIWWVALSVTASRDSRVVGLGAEEFRRVLRTSLQLFGLLAIVAFLLQVDVARGYLGVAFPLGTAGLLLTRWIWRRLLTRQREHGLWSDTVLVIGTREHARNLVTALQRQPGAGLRVVGACVSDGRTGEHIASGVPVLGSLADAASCAVQAGASTIAVTASEATGPDVLRGLSWELEPLGVDLIVAPSLTEVAGFRIHTRPVGGLPLLHVEAPRYEGANRATKRLFDLVATTTVLMLVAPLLALVAVAVRLDSPGPVLFRQERIGIRGRTFHMLKFRSMVQDAEERVGDLLHANEGSGPLFKVRNDPRITRSGRFLRRFSLDELPQLFNVLRGDMSLVGPRPPLRSEVDTYAEHVHRRLLVRPGITGLWQVSGRSDLSWEESVRLDLYYVENWSLVDDVVILLKTTRAVLAPSGAY